MLIKTYRMLIKTYRMLINADSYVPLSPQSTTRTRKSQGTSQKPTQTHIKLHIPTQISTRSHRQSRRDIIIYYHKSRRDKTSLYHIISSRSIYIIMNLDATYLHSFEIHGIIYKYSRMLYVRRLRF